MVNVRYVSLCAILPRHLRPVGSIAHSPELYASPQLLLR